MIYKLNLEEREHNLPRVMEDIRVEVCMAMKFVEDMVGVGVPKIAREMIADTVIQTVAATEGVEEVGTIRVHGILGLDLDLLIEITDEDDVLYIFYCAECDAINGSYRQCTVSA
jgi:hypothetical protein